MTETEQIDVLQIEIETMQHQIQKMDNALQCIGNAAKLAPVTDLTISAILLAGCSEMARRVQVA